MHFKREIDLFEGVVLLNLCWPVYSFSEMIVAASRCLAARHYNISGATLLEPVIIECYCSRSSALYSLLGGVFCRTQTIVYSEE